MRVSLTLVLAFGLVAACRGRPATREATIGAKPPEGRVVPVHDTAVAQMLDLAGVAEPIRRATLATRLMGSVTAVLVQEGDRVRPGQVLARIDQRDLEARRSQVEASVAEADAVRQDALTQARRMRALYADSAAAQAQLDAAETGLARADAGARAARAAAAELEATRAYADLRAPFAATVTRRHVDPGAFVAPGAPILEVEDAARLRISVTAPPEAARQLTTGQPLSATIEGAPVSATVEGVVPAGGALYTVNALVDNARGQHASGAAATLGISQGTRRAVLIPADALVREGDLTGVRVRADSETELRWIRAGREADGAVEVLSGLDAGERILVPPPARPVGDR